MRPASMFVFGLMILGLVGCAPDEGVAPAEPVEPAPVAEAALPEWTTLFDGSSIDDWDVTGDANWSLDETDNSVMADMGTGFLVTPESYGDFELTLEFWVDEPANSGIFIRCQEPEAIAAGNAYEVNIYDTREDQTYRTGGIVNFAAPSEVINTGGQWNTYEIRAEGLRLLVILNGIEMVDVEDSTYTEGPIGLQYGAGIVKFRNVQIRPL
jgi:hypothetical protein